MKLSAEKNGIVLACGLLVSFVAAVCCMDPGGLLSLNNGGDWIAKLTVLQPYKPLLVFVVVCLFTWAGWQIHEPVIDFDYPLKKFHSLNIACKRKIILFWILASLAIVISMGSQWLPFMHMHN